MAYSKYVLHRACFVVDSIELLEWPAEGLWAARRGAIAAAMVHRVVRPGARGRGAPATPWANAAAAVGPGAVRRGARGRGRGETGRYIGFYVLDIGCPCLEYRTSVP